MARPNRSGVTPSVIDRHRKAGMSQRSIAATYGVTDKHVSWVKQTYGGVSLTPREQVQQHYPWVAGVRFNGASTEKRMRDHAEYMATGGKGMSEDKLRRLAAFYRKLMDQNLVVEFDPDIPPSDGNKHGGFAFRTRKPSDGELIIRANKHTRITDEGLRLWTLPPALPRF